jgi:hypothetical protein
MQMGSNWFRLLRHDMLSPRHGRSAVFFSEDTAARACGQLPASDEHA